VQGTPVGCVIAVMEMLGAKLSRSKNGQAEKYMQCLTKEEEYDEARN